MPTNLRMLDYSTPPRAYRVLHLATDGRVLASVPVSAQSDLEALTLAETRKGQCATELWDGLRFIEHFKPVAPVPGLPDVQRREAPVASDEAPLTGCRVLLVEDDYLIATSLCIQLQDSGAQILGPVSSIHEALALIATTPEINAAVLDIGLQDEMAFPVADALQVRGIPFLFTTGYDASVIPDRYADVRYCMKPVPPIQVVQTLLSA